MAVMISLRRMVPCLPKVRLLQQELSMPATGVTIYERYDIEHVDAKDLEAAKNLIFSEPPVDTVLEEIPDVQGFVFAVEYVPGQYDQRADSAEQCISMLTLTSGHIVRCARVFAILNQWQQSMGLQT